MSDSFDPDQDQRSVGPSLRQNCLQRLSAVASKERIETFADCTLTPRPSLGPSDILLSTLQ